MSAIVPLVARPAVTLSLTNAGATRLFRLGRGINPACRPSKNSSKDNAPQWPSGLNVIENLLGFKHNAQVHRGRKDFTTDGDSSASS